MPPVVYYWSAAFMILAGLHAGWEIPVWIGIGLILGGILAAERRRSCYEAANGTECEHDVDQTD